MAINPSGSATLTVASFGGLRTDCPPTQVPAGESPQCQDVSFAPGAVFTREALKRILPTPSPNPLVWGQSFTAADGSPFVLVLDSKGTFSKVVNGALVGIGSTVPGAQVSAISANGRMYMALSDGSRGVDVPRQFDGTTGYFDRVSQGGPAVGPTVTNLALPAVQAAAGTGSTSPVVSIVSSGYIPAQTVMGQAIPAYHSTLTITLAAEQSLAVGTALVITGNTNSMFEMTVSVLAVLSATEFICSYYSSTAQSGTGGTATVSAGNTLSRSGNTVTATTAGAHNLQVGYQAQVAGFGTSTVGGTITSIVIDNETNPGLATITTSAAHGLLPNNYITINGVGNTQVGGSVSSSVGYGSMILVTTNQEHGLSVGSVVTITDLGSAPHYGDGTWTVASVPSSTQFMYEVPGANLSGTEGGASGTIAVVWPSTSSDPSDNVFQVSTCPTATTFQVAISYPDGTWSSGTINFAWDGTFYVTAVLSATSFQYQQTGPNATTAAIGTIAPQGQLAPGTHLVVEMFLTRTGFLTAPSAPVQFIADGSGYASVSSLAIGPANVVARYLAFTGANGSRFFVLPVQAQNNGLPISTSTIVNDNTTMAVVMDFSDQSLLSGLGVDIPGNNLFNQVVLEPALGVSLFANRMAWWGGRNVIGNLLNMGFEGGVLSGASNVPLGWTVGDPTGALVAGDSGLGWQVTGPGTGLISQPAFQDYYGVAILQPQTLYSFRFWASGTATVGTVTAELYGGGAVLATATVTLSQMAAGQFYQATFSAETPLVLPADTILQVYVTELLAGQSVTLDELTLGYAQNPFRNPQARLSYVNNPEAFDGVTGNLGPADDSTALIAMVAFTESSALMVTESALYAVTQAGDAEPASWSPRRLATDCGMEAVNSIAPGAGWAVWASPEAAWLFSGTLGTAPVRLSNGIQPSWQQFTVQWVVNDPQMQRVYFGGLTRSPGADREPGRPPEPERPTVWLYDYHEGIGSGKWSPWTAPAVFGAMLPDGMSFVAGSNLYGLRADHDQDDDFGAIAASYTPAAFADGGYRKLFTYLTARVMGDGQLAPQQFRDQLQVAVKQCRELTLSNAPETDAEWGLNLSGRYLFLKFAPLAGNFRLEEVTVACKPDPMTPVSGRF